MVVVCVRVCVHASWLKGDMAMRVFYCKKMLNFKIDTQTCKRFIGKVGHEPKDSWLPVQADGQKRGRGSGSEK